MIPKSCWPTNPPGNLDLGVSKEILSLFQHINSWGTTVLWQRTTATHRAAPLSRNRPFTRGVFKGRRRLVKLKMEGLFMILITGAAGFIGFHLAKSFPVWAKYGSLSGSTTYATITTRGLKGPGSRPLKDFSRFHFYEADICDYAFVHSLFDRTRFQKYAICGPGGSPLFLDTSVCISKIQ